MLEKNSLYLRLHLYVEDRPNGVSESFITRPVNENCGALSHM